MDELARYADIDLLDYLPEDSHTSFPSNPYPPASASSSAASSQSTPQPPFSESQVRKHIRKWICIYPIYFDESKAKFPRRVPKRLSAKGVTVEMIAQALKSLILPSVIEADKTHPQDPLRPGRVRTALPKPMTRRILFKQIAERLKPSLPEITSSTSTPHIEKSTKNKSNVKKKSKK